MLFDIQVEHIGETVEAVLVKPLLVAAELVSLLLAVALLFPVLGDVVLLLLVVPAPLVHLFLVQAQLHRNYFLLVLRPIPSRLLERPLQLIYLVSIFPLPPSIEESLFLLFGGAGLDGGLLHLLG